MTEFPLLPIPTPRRDARPRGGGGGGDNLRLPSIGRQGERIGPTFQRLRDAFAEARPALSLRNDPTSIAPERAIVFEIAGSIGDFHAAVRQIDGLEYLGDEEHDLAGDDDFAVIDTRRDHRGADRDDRPVGGRLYLAMPERPRIARIVAALGSLSSEPAGRVRVHALVQPVSAAAHVARMGADRPDSGRDDRLLGGGARTRRRRFHRADGDRAVEFYERAAAARSERAVRGGRGRSSWRYCRPRINSRDRV